jgi:hypothetical protein
MNENLPFSIRIFVANGDPDGLRIIERSNWNGRALVFPRPLLPENDCAKRVSDRFSGIWIFIIWILNLRPSAQSADKRSPA